MSYQLKSPLLQVHIVADLMEIDLKILRDADLLQKTFAAALKSSGFTIINDVSHKFTEGGMGVTGMFLLAESHLAYHSYPEWSYLAIDLYSCGVNPEPVLESICQLLKPKKKQIKLISRDPGIPTDSLELHP